MWKFSEWKNFVEGLVCEFGIWGWVGISGVDNFGEMIVEGVFEVESDLLYGVIVSVGEFV